MYKHLTVFKQMSSGLFKKCDLQTMHVQSIYDMYKEDLALAKLQGSQT